jgi:hypothetical protein
MVERHFTRGQFVTLTYEGQSIKAMVALASPNGRSLMLMFDGALTPRHGEGMFPGAMPLLQDDDGVYRDLVMGLEARIE